uniref:Uncharacterized protein n=1 Tax=Chlamydomonas euryale TaxID=1486919 RepID=A0A7R9YQR7_9CHLO
MSAAMRMSKNISSASSRRAATPVPAPRPPVAMRTMAQPVAPVAMAAAPRHAAATAAALPSARRSPVVAAAAAEAATTQGATATQYYAVVANMNFFFNDVQNESIAEQLRERVRFFKEINREIDFWLVPEPKWLDSKYPDLAKKVARPCVALVSTDKVWITFMKTRLDRVLRIELGAMEASEALAVGGEIPEKFEKPAKWTAPYSPYSAGWWNVFLPK